MGMLEIHKYVRTLCNNLMQGEASERETINIDRGHLKTLSPPAVLDRSICIDAIYLHDTAPQSFVYLIKRPKLDQICFA